MGVAWRVSLGCQRYGCKGLGGGEGKEKKGKGKDKGGVYPNLTYPSFSLKPHFWVYYVMGSDIDLWPPRMFNEWITLCKRTNQLNVNQLNVNRLHASQPLFVTYLKRHSPTSSTPQRYASHMPVLFTCTPVLFNIMPDWHWLIPLIFIFDQPIFVRDCQG